MTIFLAIAAASEFPWDCPAVTLPEDARVYATDDTEPMATLLAEIDRWWDASCAWEEEEAAGRVTRWCTTDVGGYQYEEAYETYASAYASRDEWVKLMELPEGVSTWRSIRVESYWGSSHYFYDNRRSGAWTGEVGDLPVDGNYSYRDSVDIFYHQIWFYLDTPSCHWQGEVNPELEASDYFELTVGGHDLLVRATDPVCPGWSATMDEVWLGGVEADTWVLGDADLDGFTASAGDCDDEDARRHPCGEDIAYDGIDQDCTGEDLVDPDGDRDGDGHHDVGVGGDDCDDTDPTIHPDAVETPYDGIDSNCDLQDPTDIDGDGYGGSPVDGTDCDDTSADVYPGAPDVGRDGIDANCDGLDGCPDSPPPVSDGRADAAKACGCAGSPASFLLPTALLLVRRRRAG